MPTASRWPLRLAVALHGLGSRPHFEVGLPFRSGPSTVRASRQDGVVKHVACDEGTELLDTTSAVLWHAFFPEDAMRLRGGVLEQRAAAALLTSREPQCSCMYRR